jgi:hypothetical protein
MSMVHESRTSKTRAGWDAALEWAAQMIETGYPEGSDPPSPAALAMTLRAKKGDVDSVETGVAISMQVFNAKRAARSTEGRDPGGEA